MFIRFALPQLSPKWIAVLLGVAGIVLLSLSVRGAGQRVEKLRSWPHVDARVSGGDVVSVLRQGRREALYAGRLQLRYDFRGRQFAVPATENIYSSHYAGQARGVREAIREGEVKVRLDPDNPAMPVLNAGYNASFFFGSLILAWIGGILVLIAAVFWRVFRAEDPSATKKRESSNEGKLLLAFFGLLGAGFLGGGLFLFWTTQRELRTWRSVDARVDSTDVVWRSSSSGGSGGSSSGSSRLDLYAARAWITYDFRDTAYHVPVVPGAYSNDSSGAAEVAAALRRSEIISARVNPANPFDAGVDRPGAVRRFWLPALFIVPGLVCLFLTWVIGRKKRKRLRRRRIKIAA